MPKTARPSGRKRVPEVPVRNGQPGLRRTQPRQLGRVVGGRVVSLSAVGTSGNRSASSSDSAWRNAAKTASPNALSQRCQPQSERTLARTASAMLLFSEGTGCIAKAAAHGFPERSLRPRCPEHHKIVPSQHDQVAFGRGAKRQASTTPRATSSIRTSRGVGKKASPKDTNRCLNRLSVNVSVGASRQSFLPPRSAACTTVPWDFD